MPASWGVHEQICKYLLGCGPGGRENPRHDIVNIYSASSVKCVNEFSRVSIRNYKDGGMWTAEVLWQTKGSGLVTIGYR